MDYPEERLRFKNHFDSEIEPERTEAYLSIFSDFFRHQGQFTQLLSHARLDDDDIEDRIVGSKSFEQIKLNYGQAFETLTSVISTLAAFNNIKSGRPFDEFEMMTWSKYTKDVEKAKRSKPFETVPEFTAFTGCLDSALRNGSHHASIWRENEKIIYRSGGSGARREMSYSVYIHMCNKITISLAAIWALEKKVL